MKSNGTDSLAKILWLSAAGLAVLIALLLIDTEARYLRFLESLDDVEVELRWSQTEESAEKIILQFEAVFRNTSDLTLWVEALNTQLTINGQSAGAPSITEGQMQIPPQGERIVPLRATLWGSQMRLFQEARVQSQSQLQLQGRTRVRLDIGGSSLKVFYDVQGTFPIGEP